MTPKQKPTLFQIYSPHPQYVLISLLQDQVLIHLPTSWCFFFFFCSLLHWSDFTWNSYSSQCLFKLFKARRSVLLSYCINMWTVSSHETINSWTVGLYHVFLLYFLFINSIKNATDTGLMLYIFSTLAPILRRQEGSGIFFYSSKSLCSLHFNAMLSTHKSVKFYFILYHLL